MSKVILVTGASSGIGAAIARVLVSQGHTVYGTGRNSPTETNNNGVHMLNMDVRDEQRVQEAIQSIVDQCGRIDVVVNNAGLGMVGAVELSNDQEIRSIFETNVFGVLHVCRHAIPHMRLGGGGYLINVTSMAGRVGLPFRGIYCATKSAVEGFSEAMSMELKQFNIHVVILEPGNVKTNIDKHRVEVERAHSPEYHPLHQQVLDQVNREVQKATQPDYLGVLVARIILNPRPRLRYRSQKAMHSLAIFLKWLLPDRMFENLMMRFYGIPRSRKSKKKSDHMTGFFTE